MRYGIKSFTGHGITAIRLRSASCLSVCGVRMKISNSLFLILFMGVTSFWAGSQEAPGKLPK
jgi:hypothetical protein